MSRPDWDTCLSMLCSDAPKNDRAKYAEHVEHVLNALTDALEHIANPLLEPDIEGIRSEARGALKEVKRDFAA